MPRLPFQRPDIFTWQMTIMNERASFVIYEDGSTLKCVGIFVRVTRQGCE